MLFRRQTDPAPTLATGLSTGSGSPAGTQAGSLGSRPLTATPAAPARTRPGDPEIRTVGTTTPIQPQNLASQPVAATNPIAQAQQRRVIATPTGSFSMPANNSGSREGQRKLQVGRDITLNGEIGACDHLAIEGTVQATILQLLQFDILDHGTFSGTVMTENADINGRFDGELTVTGRLWLRQNADVRGTIRYTALQVEKGAALRGTIDMLEAKAPLQTGTTFSQNDVTTSSAANDLETAHG